MTSSNVKAKVNSFCEHIPVFQIQVSHVKAYVHFTKESIPKNIYINHSHLIELTFVASNCNAPSFGYCL